MLAIRCNNLPVLAYKIDQLLDDPDLSARLGRNGNLRAQVTYSSGAFLTSVRKVYEDARHARAKITGR